MGADERGVSVRGQTSWHVTQGVPEAGRTAELNTRTEIELGDAGVRWLVAAARTGSPAEPIESASRRRSAGTGRACW